MWMTRADVRRGAAGVGASIVFSIGLAACAGPSPSASLDEAVASGRALSAALGEAVLTVDTDPMRRDDWEELEWHNGACIYTAPGFQVDAPASRADDPTWASWSDELNPVVQSHGLDAFGEPVAQAGLMEMTASGPEGIIVRLTDVGSLSIRQPVALDEAACTDASLPA